ncbi:MAG: C2H2-type zinc finger protein, partial [Candidatus Thiodiazotropha endolucinida]
MLYAGLLQKAYVWPQARQECGTIKKKKTTENEASTTTAVETASTAAAATTTTKKTPAKKTTANSNGDDDDPNYCAVCDVTLSDKKNMKRHMTTRRHISNAKAVVPGWRRDGEGGGENQEEGRSDLSDHRTSEGGP